MRKEILFAIGAGGIFGLIIAFGVWRLNKTVTPNENINTEASPTPTVSGITIATPNEKQVITGSSVKVSGITKPNSVVVVSGEEDDVVSLSTETGEFEVEIELQSGINQIIVTSFQDGVNVGEQKLTLIYSSIFSDYLEEKDEGEEEETSAEDQEEDATKSAENEIREIVQEKVQKAQKIGFAYLGTVTDISEQTFQLKAENGEINQVSTDNETDFVNTTSESPETIEFEDVAIGDYLIAMGFKNGNGVLEAKRILVSSVLEELKREISLGTISEIGADELEITLSNGESKILSFGKSWKGPDLDELEQGQTLAVVEIVNEDGKQTRTIEVIEDKATPSAEPIETESPSPTPEEEIKE